MEQRRSAPELHWPAWTLTLPSNFSFYYILSDCSLHRLDSIFSSMLNNKCVLGNWNTFQTIDMSPSKLFSINYNYKRKRMAVQMIFKPFKSYCFSYLVKSLTTSGSAADFYSACWRVRSSENTANIFRYLTYRESNFLCEAETEL